MSFSDEKHSSVSAFLDTNIYLHYRRFDQIDWCALLNTRSVEIVVPNVVIRELDEHKDSHHVSGIRERARGVLRVFSSYIRENLEANVRSGVRIRFIPEDAISLFVSNGLSTAVADDFVIASMLAELVASPVGEIALITNDVGIHIKCIVRKIPVINLPDDLRLPAAVDEQTKELHDLKNEVAQLTQARPRLALVFDSGKTFQRFSLMDRPSQNSLDTRIAEMLKKVKEQYTPMRIQENTMGPTYDQVRDYNRSLRRFYEDEENYLRDRTEFGLDRRRAVQFRLRLDNTGGSPADDIHVILTMPPFIRAYTAETLPHHPDEPRPPRRPQGFAGLGLDDVLLAPNPILHELEKPNTRKPLVTIESNTNGNVIKYHVLRVKHSMSELLEPIHLWFRGDADVAPFGVKYRINAGNVSAEVSGTVHLVARFQSQTADQSD